MKISIASAFYNDKRMLELTLRSVLEQTYSNIEHIVADGGSTDGSVELLREYEENYRRTGKTLIWKSEKDGGLTDAFNKAVSLSTGDYIILASDPYVDDEVLFHIAKTLKESGADYVYGGMYFQRNGRIIRQWSGRPGNWRLGWMAATPTLCMRRSIWEKHGPYDEKYRSAPDYKLQISIFRDKTLKSCPLNRTIVVYYAGGTSNGGIKANWESIKECQRILNENHIPFGWFTNLCKIVIALFAYTFASRKIVAVEELK